MEPIPSNDSCSSTIRAQKLFSLLVLLWPASVSCSLLHMCASVSLRGPAFHLDDATHTIVFTNINISKIHKTERNNGCPVKSVKFHLKLTHHFLYVFYNKQITVKNHRKCWQFLVRLANKKMYDEDG